MDVDIKTISDTVGISMEEIVNIIHEFKELFKGDITIHNIMDAVVKMMQIVGKLNKLRGADKKFLVNSVIIYMIKNNDKIDDILEQILIHVVPSVIDSLINVENDAIVINPKIKQSCMFSFCRS